VLRFLPGCNKNAHRAAGLIQSGIDDGAEQQSVAPTLKWSPLVIEVKGTLDYDRAQERRRNRVAQPGQRRRRPLSTAIDDIQNLLLFVNRYSYRAGVFILYNHTFDELNEVIGHHLRALQEEPSADQIYILTISAAHQPCEEHNLRNL